VHTKITISKRDMNITHGLGCGWFFYRPLYSHLYQNTCENLTTRTSYRFFYLHFYSRNAI